MKSKKVLAQLAALSLLFGVAGAGTAWAETVNDVAIQGEKVNNNVNNVAVKDETQDVDGTIKYTIDGGETGKTVAGLYIDAKDNKTVTMTANNVHFVDATNETREVAVDGGSTLIMNGGSVSVKAMNAFAADGGSKIITEGTKINASVFANNSTVTLKNSTTSGDVLYAGNEWGQGTVAEGLPEGRLTIDGGTANVGNVLVQNKAVFTVTNGAILDLTGDTSAWDETTVEATGIKNKGNITIRAWGPNTATAEKSNNDYVQSLDQAAQLHVYDGATVKADTIDLQGQTDTVKNVYRGKINVEGKSSVTANTMNFGMYSYGSFNDSQLTVTGKLSIKGIGYEDNYKYPYGVEINGGTATLNEVSAESYGELTVNNATVIATNISNDSSIMKITGGTVKAGAINLKGQKNDKGDIYRGKLYVSGNSSVTADMINLGAYGYGSFTNSQLTVNKKLSIEGLGYDDKYERPYGLEIDGGIATLNEVSVTKYGQLSFINGVKATLGEVTASGEGSTITLKSNDAENASAPDVTISKLVLNDKAGVDLSAGKLTANDITAAEGTRIEIKDTGILSTKSDQVYTNSAADSAKDSGDVKNKAYTFTGGTLELTDATYTKAYWNTALAALSKQTTGSKTSLIMSGKQVDESGEEVKTNTIDDMKNKSDGIILDQVTVTSDKNFLIGTEQELKDSKVSDVIVEKQVGNGFGAKDLTLTAGDGNVGVVITNEKTLTLGGKDGGDLITVVDDSGAAVDKAVKVVVGTTKAVVDSVAQAGTFAIGHDAVETSTKYNLHGEVLVNQDSTLKVNGQANISGGVALNGATAAVKEGAKLTTDKISVTDSSAITGAVATGTVTIDSGKILSIGSDKKAGELVVDNIAGGIVFLDPAWNDGNEITDASGLSIGKDTEEDSVAINTALVVGNNSKISVGAELSNAEDAFAKTGLTWGEEVNAAAYISKSAALSNDVANEGSLTVDGSLTDDKFNAQPYQAAAAGTVSFADKSLLMVDGTVVKASAERTTDTVKAAITGVTATSISEGSTLYIDNAKKGETYKILAGAGLTKKWDDGKVISSNALLEFKASTDIPAAEGEASAIANTTGTYLNYESSVLSVKKVYDASGYKTVTPDVLDKATAGNSDLNDFIMDKAVQEGVNSGKEKQASALNSLSTMTELAGAARGTYTAAGLFNDAVAEHMSLANDLTHDKDVWAKYIHSKEDIDGLDIAGSDASYKNQYNGIVVGADVYHNEKATVGVALSYGDGDISGNTLAAHTKNDAKYYGASIYGGIHNGDTAILGDISYLHSKNDITQTNSGESITGTAKANAFSIGIRAEQSLKVGDGQFVPYAGLRYMRLSNDGYTDSLGLHHDGGDLNMWLLPIGVKYSVDAKHGSWTLRPIAEIGYVWNMGDRDAREVVSFDGTNNSFGYDVTDNGSYLGHLGFEAEKGNTTFGIGYQYQKGSSVKENRWNASVNYRF